MPLIKVDDLVHTLLEKKGCIYNTDHCMDDEHLEVKGQLLILGSLNLLGNNKSFRTLHSSIEISTEEHIFLNKMHSIREDFIQYTCTPEELSNVMEKYV